MAHIPEKHKKYNLLPMSQKRNGEVFSYPSDLLWKLNDVGEAELDPYGYDSYDDYFSRIDARIADQQNPEIVNLLREYKEAIFRMNKKENWSVLKYLGEDTDNLIGLKKGRYYYWPCSIEQPVYEGVIDDEEYTSYLYPTDSRLWEIAEDPTGMAHRTIFEGHAGEANDKKGELRKMLK
jgi:hypothetical protein